MGCFTLVMARGCCKMHWLEKLSTAWARKRKFAKFMMHPKIGKKMVFQLVWSSLIYLFICNCVTLEITREIFFHIIWSNQLSLWLCNCVTLGIIRHIIFKLIWSSLIFLLLCNYVTLENTSQIFFHIIWSN